MHTLRICPSYDPSTHRATDDFVERVDLDGATYLEQVVVALTPAEIYAADLAACHEARRAAYPPVGDQLDAIAKAVAALGSSGTTLSPEVLAWLDAIAAVKAAYPKPPGTRRFGA